MTIENTKTKDFPSLLFVSNAESCLCDVAEKSIRMQNLTTFCRQNQALHLHLYGVFASIAYSFVYFW